MRLVDMLHYSLYSSFCYVYARGFTQNINLFPAAASLRGKRFSKPSLFEYTRLSIFGLRKILAQMGFPLRPGAWRTPTRAGSRMGILHFLEA